MTLDQRRYSLGRLPDAARGLAVRNPALLPALIATALFVVLGAAEAGFEPAVWYAAALFLLGLLGASLFALGRPRGVPRAALVALGLLSAYAAWSYVSIAWASQPGPAWNGANRIALYALVLALFCLWPFDARGGTLVLAALGLGIAAVGLVELLKVASSANPEGYFLDVRLAEPAGYMNANVALWTTGLLPCLFLASRRGVPVPVRGLALGGAGLLAALGLMGQSRGWALALPPALALFLLVCPGRVRLLAAMLATAAGAALVSRSVLAVHDDYTPERFDALVADASTAIFAMAAVLVVVGAVAALVDRRFEPSPALARRAGVATAALCALALAVAVVWYTVAEGSPASKLSEAWSDFKEGGGGPEEGGSRFASGGTERWDFWTVAWNAFEDEPLRGIGAENYQEEYLREGDSPEQPLYAHSLELAALSQTGLVGAVLLFGALAAGAAAALRSRAAPAAERAVAAAAVALFAYWLLHASVDWFWEFPGITAPALAALGLAGALAPRDAPRASRSRRLAALPPAVGALVLALSLAIPWLAELDTERASRGWAANPDAAFDRLERAASLNPLSARPDLTAATIALRLDRVELAEREFREALEREPRNVYALLELGVIAAANGRSEEGARLVARAAALSPNDEIVADALAELRAGRVVDLAQLNERILNRAQRFGTEGG